MISQRHFLLVDTDAVQRDLLAQELAGSMPCWVSHASTMAEGMAAATAGPRCDAVIIDVLLPDGDGREMCVRLRDLGVCVPIIMVTGAGQETDVVRGLDAGANDYVVKPFRPAELMARLRAQLRAFETSEHAEIQIGGYIFRPGKKTLQSAGHGRPIRLTEKEAAVLKYLYRSEGRPVTRETLLHEVWGYSASAATHTVETHIYKLRKKLTHHAAGEQLLFSEARGYKLAFAGSAA